MADLVAGAVEHFAGDPGTPAPALDELIALDAEVRAFCATVEAQGAAS